MGDKVIGLKNKTNGMVAISVPIPILIVLGGGAVDDQIAVGVAVQPANDIEHGRFAATRGAENGHKFILTKREGNTLEGVNRIFARFVSLFDIL